MLGLVKNAVTQFFTYLYLFTRTLQRFKNNQNLDRILYLFFSIKFIMIIFSAKAVKKTYHNKF